ncbi:MAG: indolepyruvate oxidoreductase subunit beta family protein [Caldimonas sp.]
MKPVTILVAALGGEGGGVLAEWLVETATHAGHGVQSTSIPGVAQRTGATTYYIEVFPVPDRELGGKRPVFSLNPVPGALDLLASSELLETVRQIGNGMTTPDRTHVLTSTSRSLTIVEKMQPGDGRVGEADLLRVVREMSREAEAFDMARTAREAGTVISAVLFGAIAASGALPFERRIYEETIRRSERGADASLRGFAKAFETVAGLRNDRQAVRAAAQAAAEAVEPRSGKRASEALAAFPAGLHDILALGCARLEDYQDRAYAQLYLERLGRVLAAERADGVAADDGHATTREAARFLALWMAFDDIVRVADLKSRGSRFARVRREVKAGNADVVAIVDHFKPGVAEMASLLPKALADRLLRWDRKRLARGLDAFALPLKIRSHTTFGLLLLRGLAVMRGLRRRGSRFAEEQAMIERWLAAVEAGARRSRALGFELAACGRLIKGYGATNERGKANLLHVIDHLAAVLTFGSDTERAEAIRGARTAALADEAGTAFDQAMVRHGAPPRPVKAQPIRWVGARPGRPEARAQAHEEAA